VLHLNIHSGDSHQKYGLEGELEAKVSTFCNRPKTLVTSTCLQDAISTEWNTCSNNDSFSKFGTSSIVSNILLAFETKLRKIRTKIKVSSSTMLDATCTINLPYTVERQMVLCNPIVDRDVGSVNFFHHVKKTNNCPGQIRK
jgi:hypothetical protein